MKNKLIEKCDLNRNFYQLFCKLRFLERKKVTTGASMNIVFNIFMQNKITDDFNALICKHCPREEDSNLFKSAFTRGVTFLKNTDETR